MQFLMAVKEGSVKTGSTVKITWSNFLGKQFTDTFKYKDWDGVLFGFEGAAFMPSDILAFEVL